MKAFQARLTLLTDLPREAFGGSAGATSGKRAERLSGVRCMGVKNLVVDGRVHERRGLSGALYRLRPDGLMKGTMRVTCGCCTPNATTVCIWPDRPCARWVFAEAGVLLVQRAGRAVKSRYIHSTVQDLQGGVCMGGRCRHIPANTRTRMQIAVFGGGQKVATGLRKSRELD